MLTANRIYVNNVEIGLVEHLADPDDVEVQKYISLKVVDLSIPSILSCCSAIYEDNESLTRRKYNLYIPNRIFEIYAWVNIAYFLRKWFFQCTFSHHYIVLVGQRVYCRSWQSLNQYIIYVFLALYILYIRYNSNERTDAIKWYFRETEY